MKGIGYLLIGMGLVWLIWAYNIDTSVWTPAKDYGAIHIPSRQVSNLSLMEARRTQLMLSGGAILIGVLLAGFGHVAERGHGDDFDEADEYRDCPFCAEPIRSAAVICRHCGKEVPVAEYDAGDEVENDDGVGMTPDPDVNVRYDYRELRLAAEIAERDQAGDRPIDVQS